MASADDTFTEFFRQCVSEPQICQLAQSYPNATAQELEAAAYALIDEIKYRPFPYAGSIAGYAELKAAIRFTLYSPRSWLSLDKILDTFLAEPRNETLAGMLLYDYLAGSLAGEAGPNDAGIGIECTDKKPRTNSFDVANAAFDQSQAASRLLGDLLAGLVSTCAQWGLETRERYNGDFTEVKTRKPLLVIGNTYDSASSIKGARNITATIEGSVLLEHGGFGVCHSHLIFPFLYLLQAWATGLTSGTIAHFYIAAFPLHGKGYSGFLS